MAYKVRTITLIALLVFAAQFLAGCAAQQAGEKPSVGYVRQGQKLLEQCRYQEAMYQFRKAIAIDPENANAHRGLGLAYYAQGDTYRSEVFIRRAMQLDPSMTDLWGYLGDLYLGQGKEKQAMEFFERCPESDPHYAELHYRLGKIKLFAGNRTAAKDEFDKALSHADFWGGYWGKGVLAQRDKKWDKALEWFRDAQSRGEQPEIYLGLAQTYDTLMHTTPAYFYYTLYLGTEPPKDEAKQIAKRIKAIEDLVSLTESSIERDLHFNVHANTDVRAGICGKDGKLVKILFSGTLSHGQYDLKWDGKDEAGKPVKDGEYLGFVVTGEDCQLHKFVIE